MKTLFKITANYGYKSQSSLVYYVIAKDSTTAEKLVKDHHAKNEYSTVDFCHSETIAQSGNYGKPVVLLG